MAIQPFLHLPPPAAFRSFVEITTYLRRLLDSLKTMGRGKIECVAEITLTANAASSVLSDIRISKQSVLAFHPRTANAAAELAAGTMYVTDANMGSGTATITHANNAQTDRDFRVAIIG